MIRRFDGHCLPSSAFISSAVSFFKVGARQTVLLYYRHYQLLIKYDMMGEMISLSGQ